MNSFVSHAAYSRGGVVITSFPCVHRAITITLLAPPAFTDCYFMWFTEDQSHPPLFSVAFLNHYTSYSSQYQWALYRWHPAYAILAINCVFHIEVWHKDNLQTISSISIWCNNSTYTSHNNTLTDLLSSASLLSSRDTSHVIIIAIIKVDLWHWNFNKNLFNVTQEEP